MFNPWCGRPLTFEVWSIKLEMNYFAHQKRDDWTIRRFQNNTSSTELLHLVVGIIHKNKENVYPS